MSAFWDAMKAIVLEPWEKECPHADYPWMATPELRQRWLRGLEAEDDAESLACALGLARCANRTSLEHILLDDYCLSLPEGLVSDSIIVELMLEGGCPPAILDVILFAPQSRRDPCPEGVFWTWTTAFLRHPAMATMSAAMAELETTPLACVYACAANPMVGLGTEMGLEEYHQPWLRALRIFHPLYPHPKAEDLISPLDKFAFFLRSDLRMSEFYYWERHLNLSDPWYMVLNDHPAVQKGACPQFHPANPTLEAIEYFEMDNDVCALHRFYNPMLCKPWLCEDIVYSDEPWINLALLLLGQVPTNLEALKIMGKSNLIQILKEHPCFETAIMAGQIEAADVQEAERLVAAAAADVLQHQRAS